MRSAGFAPVKGMRHLAHDQVLLDERGAVGDRAWCLVDPERAVVLRTVQNPSLLAVTATSAGDVLTMTLPTGESVAAWSSHTEPTDWVLLLLTGLPFTFGSRLSLRWSRPDGSGR